MKIKCVLSIAGSDSGAGAGIQADMKSVAACGGYCTTAITAITAQNTVGVTKVEILSNSIVKAQIDAIMSDFNITAIKIGMVPSIEIVDVIIDTIKNNSIKNVVLDPVMVSTSGDMLVSQSVITHIIKNLLPHCSLVTPNIPEAEFISKIKIESEKDFQSVADFFSGINCKSLLLKAGHMNSQTLTDYLYNFDNNSKSCYQYQKIDTQNTHGTGCSLSSSIAAYLSQGDAIEVAVEKAEEYIHEAIEAANYVLGDGHGAINHFYKWKL